VCQCVCCAVRFSKHPTQVANLDSAGHIRGETQNEKLALQLMK